MDEHRGGEEQRGAVHGQVHLPDPSVWPLLAGVSAFLTALALIYWTRDRSSDYSGPLLGAAVLLTLSTIVGWAYEDSRMRRKAEARVTEPPPRNPRFTQLMTFGVPEGQFEGARSTGIIGAIEASDSALRDLAGFQDLRIIASPARTGPSQVIVETTWSDREGLASYQQTRQTMLDFVGEHPEQVAPGSVQVFDMEVVRDTKEVGFKFGLGAAITVLAAFVVGGFGLGAGLTLFQESSPPAEAVPGGGGAAPPAGGGFDGTIVAKGTKFLQTEISLPPNTEVSLTFDNQDAGIPHNIHFFNSESPDQSLAGCTAGCDPAPEVVTPIKPGVVQDKFTFTTPGPGTYLYHCDVHPTQMKGILTVKEGAPAPGQAPPAEGGGGGGAAAPGGVTVVATDNQFDKTELEAPAGQPFTVNFQNNGQTKHNLHFYDKQGGNTLADGAGSDSKFVDPGTSETLTFTPPGPGTYYFQCDLHPTQMNGVFTVS